MNLEIEENSSSYVSDAGYMAISQSDCRFYTTDKVSEEKSLPPIELSPEFIEKLMARQYKKVEESEKVEEPEKIEEIPTDKILEQNQFADIFQAQKAQEIQQVKIKLDLLRLEFLLTVSTNANAFFNKCEITNQISLWYSETCESHYSLRLNKLVEIIIQKTSSDILALDILSLFHEFDPKATMYALCTHFCFAKLLLRNDFLFENVIEKFFMSYSSFSSTVVHGSKPNCCPRKKCIFKSFFKLRNQTSEAMNFIKANGYAISAFHINKRFETCVLIGMKLKDLKKNFFLRWV